MNLRNTLQALRFAHGVAVVVTLLGPTATALGAQDGLRVLLPEPTGPYGIGTRRMVMIDSTRGEPANADATKRRELVVQFWYPTDRERGPGREPYLDTATARTWVERHRFPVGFQHRIGTHADRDARVAGGRHPTLIFSHGLSWPVLMYQGYFEDLASHGYMIAAVNHTHGADVVVFPDGRQARFNFFPQGLNTAEARDSVLVTKVALWSADLRFVADELQRMARTGHALAAAAELDRLGVFGHSYGGSAAAIVLRDDPRFAAGLAMEGLVRDSLIRPLAMQRPFMHIIGGFNRSEMAGTQYRAGDAPYYEVVVEGMWHAMFSDLILLYAALAADSAWRDRHAYEMTPERGLSITRDLTRAFFDRWLRNKDSPLLHPWWPPEPSSKLTSPYPEVDLRIDHAGPAN